MPRGYNVDPNAQRSQATGSGGRNASTGNRAEMPEYGVTYTQLRDAAMRAEQAGDMPAVQHFVARMKNKEYDEEMNDLASAALGASQGATFGFGDELYGALRGAGALVPGGQSPMEAYGAGRDQVRTMLDTARREDPWATGLGELGGGLLTGGTGMARSAAGMGLRAGLTRAAGMGAAMGGTAGYGYSEGDPLAAAMSGGDIASEAAQAGVDAALGTAAGGVIGTALPAIGAAARSVGRFLIKRTGAGKRYVLNEAGRQQVMDALTEDLKSGNMTLSQAQAELRNTPGMVAADLGPAMRDLTDRLAQTATEGGRRVRESLQQRAIDQYDRMMPSLSDALGGRGGPSQFARVSQQLMDSAKTAAAPLYEQAYAQPMQISRRMQQILQTPLGVVGRRGARTLARQQERRPVNPTKVGEVVGMEDLDLILRSMDDHVSKLYKSGDTQLANAARDSRNEFRELLYQANPTFRSARQAWAGHAASNDALEAGLKIFREDADVTARMIGEMSEGEKTYFRVGVLRALERRLGNKSDTADLVKGIADRRNVRDALSVAFGDPQKFDNFMQLMAGEKAMFDTFSQAVGNSATARRLMQANDAGMENLAALAGYGATLGTIPGLPPSIGGNLAKRAYQAIRGDAPQRAFNQIADRQSGLLMGTDLQQIMQPHTLGGLLSGGAPSSARALAGSTIAGGFAQPGLLE